MSKLKFHFAGFFMSGLWLYFILDFKLVRVSVCVCVCILSFVIFWHCILYSSPVLGLHSFWFFFFFFFFLVNEVLTYRYKIVWNHIRFTSYLWMA